MNKKYIILSIKIIFVIISVLIPFVPYAEVFLPKDGCVGQSCWERISISADFFMMVLYIPYLATCSIYLWMNEIAWLKLTPIIASVLYLLNLILSVLAPMQDFVPIWGTFFIALFHFCAIFLFVFKRRVNSWLLLG